MSLEDGANDKEERAHANGGDDERQLAAEGLDGKEDEDGGGNDLYNTVDPRCEKRVLGARISDGGEDLRRVVTGSYS